MRLWCQQGRFPNAYTRDESRGPVWVIPEGDLKGFEPPKMGRPRKEAATPAKKGRRGVPSPALMSPPAAPDAPATGVEALRRAPKKPARRGNRGMK